jgi:hypothetical protein
VQGSRGLNGLTAVRRRLEQLGRPLNADLAAWLEGIRRKDEDRICTSASGTQLPSIPASDAADPSLSDSHAPEPAADAAAMHGDSINAGEEGGSSKLLTSSTSVSGRPSADSSQESIVSARMDEAAAVQLLPRAAAAPLQGLPESVLWRLPGPGRSGRACGPSAARQPAAEGEQERQSSLESQLLEVRNSSVDSEASGRFGSLSSEDSLADHHRASLQVACMDVTLSNPPWLSCCGTYFSLIGFFQLVMVDMLGLRILCA